MLSKDDCVADRDFWAQAGLILQKYVIFANVTARFFDFSKKRRFYQRRHIKLGKIAHNFPRVVAFLKKPCNTRFFRVRDQNPAFYPELSTRFKWSPSYEPI